MNATDFAHVPLGKIAPSPHNPRRSFDPAKLQQLADSIKEKGVLEPILVRSKPPGPDLARELRAGLGLSEATIKAFLPYGIVTLGDLLARGDEIVTNGNAPANATPAKRVYHAVRTIPGTRSYEAKELAQLFDAGDKNAGEDLPVYELVAGERRWRAAKLAGLTEIPCLVRQLGDKEAAEVQVVENDQREDVPPLEQAAGYQRLIDLGDDVATIAAKIGRPSRYVFARLQLTKLIPELQEDLEKGWIGFGHAHLLARLSPADQKQAFEGVLYDYLPMNLKDGDPEVISVEDLRHRLRSHYVQDLSEANWKLDDADLVPVAGACTTCPKRSGHNPSLFDEILNGEAGKKTADYCLDQGCFQSKVNAFVQLSIRSHQDKTGQEPLLVTTNYYRSSKLETAIGAAAEAGHAGEVLTADQFEIIPAKKLKSTPSAKPAVIVDGDGVGKAVYIVAKKKSASSRNSSGNDDSYRRYQQDQKRQKELLDATAAAAFKKVQTTQDAEPLWKLLAPLLLEAFIYGDRGRVARAVGVKAEDLEQFLEDGTWATRTGFLVAALLIRGNATAKHTMKESRELLAATGVDVGKIKMSLKEDRSAKKATKKSKRKKVLA